MKLFAERNTIREDLARDWETFRFLKGLARLEFIYDYYKWYILAILFIIYILISVTSLMIQGNRPKRLQVCVTLNADYDHSEEWFDIFTEELTSDGQPGLVEINNDQPFDYDNMYSYVQEMKIMTQVSSQLIDVAICNSDLYSYLLALNACASLDEVLPEDLYNELSEQGVILYETAGIHILEDGTEDTSDTVNCYFGIRMTDTNFARTYDENTENAPLYCVIIRNTAHMDDSIALIRALFEES